MKIPLFPLKTVLGPGGRMPIQFFEPRYLDMLSRCLRQERGFVVVLIREGSEAGECTFYTIGTYVRVVDFEQLPNGLLGITAEGESKVVVLEVSRQDDGLYVGDVEWLLQEESVSVPEQHLHLVIMLQDLLRHPVVSSMDMEIDFDNASHVGHRLVELLPLESHDKQFLMAMTDPIERLEHLDLIIRRLGEE